MHHPCSRVLFELVGVIVGGLLAGFEGCNESRADVVGRAASCFVESVHKFFDAAY